MNESDIKQILLLDLFPADWIIPACMKKIFTLCLAAFILLIISCNGSTPDAGNKTSAPVPEFIKEIESKEVVQSANETSNIDPDFYKYFAGGFSLLGFEGETSAKEISDIDVLGSNVTFSWTEQNGVYTYIGQGDDIAIELKYNTVNGFVDIMQVSKGYGDPYYCFVVFKGTGIKYDNKNKTLDGEYTAYLAVASDESGEYYLLSLGEGFAHSDENATGILTAEFIKFGGMNDNNENIMFKTDPTANLETGEELITQMKNKKKTFPKEELDAITVIDIKVLYAKNGSYYQYPGNEGAGNEGVDTATPEEMACYLKNAVSEKWVINPDDLPATASANS